MNFIEQRFYLSIVKTSLLFKDLELILNIAKLNFEKEKISDPNLSIPILDNYINIVHNYRLSFENLSLIKINEMDLNTINGSIAGFGRSFENPLLFSEDWYQKIVAIERELSQNFREINDFLMFRNNNLL